MNHADVMSNLKTRLNGINSFIDRDRPAVYLEYPVYDNVGDLLIHQGAESFLADNAYKLLGQFSMHDFARRPIKTVPDLEWKQTVSDLDALVKTNSPTLIMQGGGNFGDVWPEFQKFREMVVRRYPDSPIVIFPQSIHFSDAAAKRRAVEVFGVHKKLHVFVRDAESWDFISNECGLPGAVMPDMAHHLWERLPRDLGGVDKGLLLQRRRDKESCTDGDQTLQFFDWDDLRQLGERFLIRSLRKWQGIDNPLRHYVSNYSIWRIYRDNLVNRAIAHFRPYSIIDTDRLHGMILGSLMAKQVIYGDGNYGKLHRYAKAWLSESPQLQSAMGEPVASIR